MSLAAMVAMTVCIFVETAQQLAFKAAAKVREKRFLYNSLGIGLHVLQLASWFFALTMLPLSVATPLLGAAYVTVALCSRFLFGEPVGKRHWIGIVIIIIGLIFVSQAET